MSFKLAVFSPFICSTNRILSSIDEGSQNFIKGLDSKYFCLWIMPSLPQWCQRRRDISGDGSQEFPEEKGNSAQDHQGSWHYVTEKNFSMRQKKAQLIYLGRQIQIERRMWAISRVRSPAFGWGSNIYRRAVSGPWLEMELGWSCTIPCQFSLHLPSALILQGHGPSVAQDLQLCVPRLVGLWVFSFKISIFLSFHPESLSQQHDVNKGA